jgi:type IV pilus assembly protein PilB
VLGQRLVRRICEHCKTPYTPTPETLAPHFVWDEGARLPVWYRGAGCPHCAQTGYRGRLAIHEFLRVSPGIRAAILQSCPYAEVRELAYQEGFRDMRYDGLIKALQGLTTLDEVARVTAAE